VDPIRRKRRLTTGGWLLAAGIVLPLLGLWVTTWEVDWHLGSVWTYMNQMEATTEPWSHAAIRSNKEFVITAATLALGGLTCLGSGIAVIVRTLRRDAGPLTKLGLFGTFRS
jgi:hypothetical protein